MANMTRDQMREELKARGWSRFLDASLEKYLDWSLQDIYAKAGFDRAVLSIATIAATTDDVIPFATISGGSDDSINEIKSIYIQLAGGGPRKIDPGDQEGFLALVWPNSQSPAPDTGIPEIYFVFDKAVYLYPKPNPDMDIHIHHMLREDLFSGGSDVTNLPERFDKAIIMLAEVHCNRRSHNYEDMIAAQSIFDQFLLDELGREGSEMTERVDRIMAWRA